MFRKACFTSVYDRYLHVILSRIPLISMILTHIFRKKVCRNAISQDLGDPTRFGKLETSKKQNHLRTARFLACGGISESPRTPSETKAFLMRIPLLPRGAVAVPLFSTCAKEVGVHLGYMDHRWEGTERLLGGVRKPTKTNDFW